MSTHLLTCLPALLALQYAHVFRVTSNLSPNLRDASEVVLKSYVPRAKAVFAFSVLLLCSPLLFLFVPSPHHSSDRPIAILVLAAYLTTNWTAGHVRNMFLDRMLRVLQSELVSGPSAEQGKTTSNPF
jgi:hypothetical protein